MKVQLKTLTFFIISRSSQFERASDECETFREFGVNRQRLISVQLLTSKSNKETCKLRGNLVGKKSKTVIKQNERRLAQFDLSSAPLNINRSPSQTNRPTHTQTHAFLLSHPLKLLQQQQQTVNKSINKQTHDTN